MAKNTIILKDYLHVRDEKIADAALYPGMLLELDSDDEVSPHSVEGGNALPIMFAVENELEGEGIDDQYAAGDKVFVWIPQRGDEVYAILKDDSTEVVIGTALESAGDGYLQPHVSDVESFESAEAGSITVYPNQIVAIAIEALDLSNSSGSEESSAPLGYNKRIKVRIV